MLASRDGKIVCENTLDARLDVVFRKKLPEVPTLIFTFLCGVLLIIIYCLYSNTYLICCFYNGEEDF